MAFNPLLHQAPTAIRGIELNTTYRAMVAYELSLHDGELTDEQKISNGLEALFGDRALHLPFEELVAYLTWYHAAGAYSLEQCQNRIREGVGSTSNQARPYCFEMDKGVIYSDFLAVYGINLLTAELHWWEFKFLFDQLPPDTRTQQRKYYRTVDVGSIKEKRERERVLKMKNFYALNRDGRIKTVEEAEQEFLAKIQKQRDAALAYTLQQEMS